MSSRRKSRPVRRLDMICSKLMVGQGDAEQLEWHDSVGDAERNTSPGEDSGDGIDSPESNQSGEYKGLPNTEKTPGPPKAPSGGTRPPEGVYVLQPEGVSDDEDSALKGQHRTQKSAQYRKRSHEEEQSRDSVIEKTQEPWSGLDLSVKRPRMETGHDKNSDSSKQLPTPRPKSVSPNMFSDNGEGTSNLSEQLERYHRLMQLVKEQKPLAQAMEETGLSVHEFFALHRLNNQLSSAQQPYNENPKILSAPPTISTVFDKFSSKDHLPSAMPIVDMWTNGKENHDAKIQALIKEANEDVLQQQKKNTEAQQLNNSRLQQQPTTLNPSMTAALMASLTSNSDQDLEERQGVLRNIFLKSQGYFSQTNTPNKNKDNVMSTTSTPSNMDRSTSSKNDSITAGTVSSGVGSIKKGTLDPSNFDEEVFDQYIAKFSNINRCASLTCPYFTRDHYHCVVEDCNYQRFTNKADVIRHYNMHKKRDNSLAHGFLRFSPTEDCSMKYNNCHLNGKSTHYHCMQPDCNKVYTSTSDVMTHENFHKKYMQFVCSGFKRFRATEQCDLISCAFRNQKTTHFHCTRSDCNFTFKNKCDIEKHKTYHMRDDSYISKGFKKFYKNEACSNSECVWNYTANHFHCLRPGCNFSFTSTSQMESHKRKHDRNEFLADTPEKEQIATAVSAASTSETFNLSRKPDSSAMSHYKLPPRTLKFTQFVPPTPPFRKDTLKTRLPCNTSGASLTYPTQMLLSPGRHPLGIHARGGQLIVPGSTSLSSGSPAADRAYLPHSLLSPFSPYMAAVASRCMPNNLQAASSQSSPKITMFNPLFQEAARKLLASMPAGTLAHGALSATQLPDYKNEIHQGEGSYSLSQRGPVSPGTPAGMGRNFSASGFLTPQSTPSAVTAIAEAAWKQPPSYRESPQVPADLFASPGLSNKRENPPLVVSQGSKDLEVSRADWPRTGGVISPSMARSAAAALKSGDVAHAADDVDPDMEGDNGAKEIETGDKPADSDQKVDNSLTLRDTVFKYFACALAFKCWIPSCDFYEKHHFHCLVENCKAMFTTPDNVLKHANFHKSLESMGAALPIQAVSVPVSKNLSIVPKSEPEDPDLPPGYITLNSGSAKTQSSDYADDKRVTASLPSPSPTSHPPDANQDALDVKQESTWNLYPRNGLPFSQTQIPTLASQIYASALLKGTGTPSSSNVNTSNSQPLTSTPCSAYKFLHNQASLSALMGQMAQASAVISSAAEPATSAAALVSADADSQVALYPSKKAEGGYVHIKAGMPCLRRDCKYMQQNHWHCTINRCRYVCKSVGKAQTHRQAHDSLEVYARSAKQSFRSYSVKKKCPNPSCEFRLRGHYHCLKPGCQFSTIGTSKLPWHMKKHEKIARREASGFKYFTKKEQCGHYDCKYNGLFSHYHCVRTGCTFAFQYKHQMSTHVRKHIRRMLGRSYKGDVQDIDHTNVDSGDDSLPLIIDEMEEAEQRPGVRISEEQLIAQDQDRLSKQQLEVLERMTKQMKSSHGLNAHEDAEDQRSIVGAAGQDKVGSNTPVVVDNEDANLDINPDYHGALDLTSLAARSSKHDDIGRQHSQDLESFNEDSNSNGLGNTTDEADGNTEIDNVGSPPNHSPSAKPSPGRGPYFSKFKLGEDLMSGFQRFEVNENCGEEKCAYIYKVSHYHCTRENCYYRFTGRTHMFKHQQHHDRVAGLVRDDFKRFKASNPCEDERCEFRGKNTHFHCLRCTFRCTDSAKVGTHRRQHIKADTLEQSGFQRVRGKDDCGREDCKYRFRNMSHFHCLQPGCNYTIVGLTGIELHAEKHKRGLLQPTVTQPNNTSLILHNLGIFQSVRQQMLNASMADRLLSNGIDDNGAAHNLSLPALAFHETQSQMTNKPQTPVSPQSSSDNGHSNQASPFHMSNPNDPSPILSKFAFLSSSSPAQGAIVTAASSPVSSSSVAMVTEGVGS